MTVQHFHLTPENNMVTSTYLSTMGYAAPGESFDIHTQHPGSYSVCANGPLQFDLYHGRFDADEDMEDWGFEGPTFNCLSVAHDPDRVLIQGCDCHALTLAQRLGIQTEGDTQILHYHTDLLTVPNFRDGRPAYFGDHSVSLT